MFNAYGQDEGFRKQPYLLLKQDTVTIMWQLYSPQNCTFKYKKATDSSFTNVAVNTPYIDTLYKYELTNLDYNTLYEFEVLLADGHQCSGSFLSPPLSTAQQISFYGYGDTRGDGADGDHPPFHDGVCKQIVAEIDSCPSSQTLIIHAADWNHNDTEMMWDSQYFYKEDTNAIKLRTKIGVVGCIGNHEDSGIYYRKYWPYEYPLGQQEDYFWHSFDYGPVHFCFADQRWPNSSMPDSATQIAWIRHDLRTSNKPWKILVFHPPVYTVAKDPLVYNVEKAFFDGICDSTEVYGVNMLINGHIHRYSDWLVNGIHHLTLGGGGSHKDPNEPDLLDDDPTNPNIIKFSTVWNTYNFAKFDVNDGYIRVKVPLSGTNENWEIFDEFIIPHSFTIKDGASVVWEDHGVHYYADEIRVEDGGELTIKGDIEFQRDGKIIVEPGGQLTVDGALLTCLGEYNDIETHWQGIQVWGDKTENQFEYPGHPLAQGKLELINGATIENAIIGVDLWNPSHWGTTGGMVFADSAIFRNNTKSVHALLYKNYHPIDTLQEMDYQSNFKNCTFEITEDYPGEEIFYKHVDLAYVKGIGFQACDFYLADNVSNVSDYTHGIAGYDAKFRVSAICSSPQSPCPEIDYDKCTFTGFYSAISAVNDGGSPVTFSVNSAEFIDNSYGVKTREMNNASVLFSNFEIGHLWDCGAGIFSDNVTGFAFEENDFSKYSGGPVSDYFGIIIYNSMAVNEVYKNDFEGLSYANFSDGINWEDNRFEGLAYFCNENVNNYTDFYVADYNLPDEHSGIQSIQGNDNYAAGNTFTQSGATWHFYNGGEHLVGYYYEQGNDEATPDNEKIYHVAKVGSNDTNNCLSHYGGNSELKLVLTSQQKADAEQLYYNSLNDYNNIKTLYESYIDGGDTEGEKLDIQTAQPDDIWALRTQLLGDSPHLSFDVLKEAADKTSVFTESVLFDILAANPDELKKDTLISYLENKEEPLPDYMIDLLKQLAEGTTYKTALQQQMAGYKHSYTRAAHEIIRSNLNDTVTDYNELRNWLDNLGGITSDRQIITSYISEGNFTDALTLANMLPQLYNMEGNGLTEHNYYMDMLDLHQTLYQQGRNTFQLDSIEKADILFIANNSNGIAGAQAKSILEAVYDEYYANCPEADGTVGYKRGNIINPDALGKAYGLNISVKPNPAKQWAAFDYTLSGSETNATITITSATGSTIEILEVNGQQGQKLWDTRSIKPGIYIYTIRTAGFSQSGKIVISK